MGGGRGAKEGRRTLRTVLTALRVGVRGVPAVRVHGMGCIDMDVLWLPYPEYSGHDPSDVSNFDWGVADACWCEETTARKATAIEDGKSQIEELSQLILELNAAQGSAIRTK